jgi:hypothetical protein
MSSGDISGTQTMTTRLIPLSNVGEDAADSAGNFGVVDQQRLV